MKITIQYYTFMQQSNSVFHRLSTMYILYDSFKMMRKTTIFVLIMTITASLRCGSINHQYFAIRGLHSILSFRHSLILDITRPTLSAEYRAFEDLIRIRPITQYDLQTDVTAILKDLRSSSSMNLVILKPSQCKVTREIFKYNNHTVDGYWIENHQRIFQRQTDRIIVYFHGGGYILGDIHSKLFNIFIQKENVKSISCCNRL